jgi:hypothetical protein
VAGIWETVEVCDNVLDSAAILVWQRVEDIKEVSVPFTIF